MRLLRVYDGLHSSHSRARIPSLKGLITICFAALLLGNCPGFAQVPQPAPSPKRPPQAIPPKKTSRVLVVRPIRKSPKPRSFRVIAPRTRTVHVVSSRPQTVRLRSSVAKTTSRTSTKTATATITNITDALVSVRLDKADKTLGSQLLLPFGLGTRFVKNNLPVRYDAFQTGDKVSVRFTVKTSTVTTTPTLSLKTLWDAPSYAVAQHERKDICVGTVSRFTGEAIEVRRDDGSLHLFSITDKTLLRKGNDAAGVADYPTGAAVAVKPRGLPSGTLMASIIAESAQSVGQIYTDGLTRWEGTIAGVEPASSTLTMRRNDSAVRKVAVAPDAVIKQGRSELRLADLTAGQPVRLHLVKGSVENGFRVADTVTIITPRKTRASISNSP